MSTSDPDLSKLLQSWQPKAPSDMAFQRQVWSRIENAELTNPSFNKLREAFTAWTQKLAHPQFALAALVIALFIGGMVGKIQARSAQEEQYLLSVNPYVVNSTQVAQP